MSSDRTPDEAPDEAVRVDDEVTDMVDRARLTALFDAREQAAEAIRDAPLQRVEMRQAGQPPAVVAEHVRSAVTAYVLEAEPLFQNTEEGRELWRSSRVGPIPLTDPSKGVEWYEPPDATVINVRDELVRDDHILVPGIGTYVSLPSPIEVVWEGEESVTYRRGNATKDRQERAEVRPPVEVSEAVFRASNRLLADIGLGLEAETVEDGEVSFDYSDLI